MPNRKREKSNQVNVTTERWSGAEQTSCGQRIQQSFHSIIISTTLPCSNSLFSNPPSSNPLFSSPLFNNPPFNNPLFNNPVIKPPAKDISLFHELLYLLRLITVIAKSLSAMFVTKSCKTLTSLCPFLYLVIVGKMRREYIQDGEKKIGKHSNIYSHQLRECANKQVPFFIPLLLTFHSTDIS